ncbi:response regulator transcription factor [Ramlibacter sp. MMS24-I3-19]|uniref:response regulator transcription factor n=1 Tax=Ramlibacter sp. MMS24-I3-19 TaxID=3416606 RepID=UPI003D00B4DD
MDDDNAKRYSLSRVVAMGGYQPREAASGLDALALLDDVSAVVLDVHLPDLHGFEVCARIRQQYPALPIVHVSTVFVDQPYPLAGRFAGANYYLVPPIEPSGLIELLDRLVQSQPARPASR